MTNTVFQIAIDGPVAAGKGTVSVALAKKLGFLYVDTGAMYRCAAMLAIQRGISLDDETAIVTEVKKHSITMRVPDFESVDGRLTSVFVDGADVSMTIRSEEISGAASRVAVHPLLRIELVRAQQEIARSQSVVMEGRDIGTKVLPEADLKIYLDADLPVRVQRRYEQLRKRGEPISLKEVEEHILERDTREMTRAIDPLRPAADGWIVDTTDQDIETVVEMIYTRVRAMQREKEGQV